MISYNGFDGAIVGIGVRCGQPDVLIYSYAQMVEILVGEGLDRLDAEEYLDFNVVGMWVGEETPIILFPFNYEPR